MSLRVEDIEIGATYSGGKNGEKRTAVQWGAGPQWLCRAPTRERLVYGGFVRTRCTSTASFAKWATSRVLP